MVLKKNYCFDTSALFDAGIRWYPPDSFPSFWQALDNLIAAGRLCIPTAVAEEATHKTHVVAARVKEWRKKYPGAFLDVTPDVQSELIEVTGKFPGWTAKGRNKADPFVVATAKAKNLVVVTGEQPSVALPMATPRKDHNQKVPNVCDAVGVPWLGIPDLVKQEGWSF